MVFQTTASLDSLLFHSVLVWVSQKVNTLLPSSRLKMTKCILHIEVATLL